MASEKTENLGLTIYPDITDVYQRELRRSYVDNFRKIDASAKILEEQIKAYLNERLGAIENGSY